MIKKGRLIIFILLAVFFFQAKDVKAFVGSHVYDINSVSVEGSNLVITGWAVASVDINPGDFYISSGYKANAWETHNIDPDFTFYIYNRDGDKQIYRFTNKASGAGDYSLPYWDNYGYCPTTRCYYNADYRYINSNFRFEIPIYSYSGECQSSSGDCKDTPNHSLQYIRKQLPLGRTGLIMILNIILNGSEYGGSPSSANQFIKQAYVNIQNNRLSNLNLFELEPLVGFINNATKVQLVATNAKVRCIGSDGWSNGLLANRVAKGSHVCGAPSSIGNPVIFGNGSAGATYNVYGQLPVNYNGISYWFYKVCVDENGYDTTCPGVRSDTYIPAFWAITPQDTSPSIVFYNPYPCNKTNLITNPSLSDTDDTQNLTCKDNETTSSVFDKSDQTVLKYADDRGTSSTADDHIYCELKCSEKLTTTFQAAPSVRAGTGFKYPVMFSGTRTCNYSYNSGLLQADLAEAKDWDERARRIDNEEIVDGARKGSGVIIYSDENSPQPYCSWWKTRYITLQDIKSKCESININDWKKNGNYQYDIKAKIEGSASTSEEPNNGIAYKKDDVRITDTEAAGNTQSNWTLTSVMSAAYSFSQAYYIEKYTGKKVTEPSNDVNYSEDEEGNIAQYKFFTELNEYTGTYNLDLKLTGVGRNIGANWDRKWNINLDCNYKVDNKIFPREDDKNYDEYGGVAFSFRQISLTNPFPGRQPRENWKGKANLITNTADNVYDEDNVIYFAKLQPADMLSIRSFNDNNDYNDFDMVGTTEQSKFICNTYPRLYLINQCNK